MSKITHLFNVLRLALFPISYGLAGALTGGTLNRVLIADLGISPTFVGLLFAIPLLEAPVRVWLGYRSDGYPVLGKRREPYILAGALLTALGVVLAVWVAVSQAPGTALLVVGSLLTFLLFGFGRNLSHNTFQALLADSFTGNARARAVTLYEVATLLGLVVGAGALGGVLGEYDPQQLLAVTLVSMTVAFVLALVAVLGNEKRSATSARASQAASQVPFMQALRTVVLPDAQVRRFFILVLFTFIGTLAQDVLLEPYGALVLGMDVGATTQLTAFWGVGVMIAMLLSGLLLIRFLGFKLVLRAGLVVSMVAFGGLIAVGSLGSVGAFRGLVLVMGLGTGMAGAGMLTGVIHFTTLIRAGMLMGVWGTANLIGRASGSLIGGAVVEVMQNLTGSPLAAYSTVFGLEALLLVVALGLSFRLDFGASRAHAEEAQVFAEGLAAAAD